MNLFRKITRRAGSTRRIFASTWIRRPLIICFTLYCIFYFKYLTSHSLTTTVNNPSDDIIPTLSSASKKNPNIEVQAFFPNSTIKINNIHLAEFSGEYEEVPPIITRKNADYNYDIDEIYFIITTNSRRIHHSIHFVKFWAKFPGVKCLIVFEYNDFMNNRNITEYLANEGVSCKVQPSNVSRFEERYLNLFHHAWTYQETDDKYIDMKKVKWFAVGDDDTIWFITNLLYTLQQYDSSKQIYLGDIADRTASIQRHGSYYAYGGGGILLSRALIPLFAKHVHECKQFLHMYGGDEMIGKCVTEVLKVNLTRNGNFHQMDNGGDVTGLFESGIDQLASIHHMFYLWRPFPDEHSNQMIDTMHLIELAHKAYDEKFLKRYVQFNHKTNQTMLLTMGYSFSIFNRILSHEELIQIEKTWCCTEMVERKTRPKEQQKTTWYFRRLTTKTSDRIIDRGAVYENRKNITGQLPLLQITLMH